MTAPLSPPVAAGLVVGLLSALLATTPAHALDSNGGSGGGTTAGTGDVTPLTLRLRTLAPAVVPEDGPLLMTGTVTNDSTEEWLDVNVAPFVGDTALTTRDELELAAATPEETAVGARLSEPGTFATIGDLDPGDTAQFAVSVPRDALPSEGATGVYWIGVHALGTGPEGRDSVADGRARTFVTLPERAADPDDPDTDTENGTENGADTENGTDADAGGDEPAAVDPVPLAVVLPLRGGVFREADGSLDDPDRWVASVGADGRYDRLVGFAETAADRPLGWVVDPAVLDALDDLGRGDPPLSLGPPDVLEPVAPTTASGAGDATGAAAPPPDGPPPGQDDGDADPNGGGGDVDDQPAPEEPSSAPGAAEARGLSERLQQLLAGDRVLATPYADTDTVALLRRAPALVQRAVDLTARSLQQRGLAGETVLASPSGRADPALLDRLPEGVGLLLSDRGDLELPVAGTVEDRPTLLADARAGAGGPAPTSALDALAVRQRLLAETALESRQAEADDTSPRPVTVVLPPSWDPGPDWQSAGFFDALDVPWVSWSAAPSSTAALDLQLDYPAVVRQREIGTANTDVVDEQLRVAATLGELLTNDNDVVDQLTASALQAVTYDARQRRPQAAALVQDQTDAVQRDLDRVGVFGSEFVTLSGGSGTLTVTVVNDLAQPVAVAVDVRTDEDVRVERVDAVALGPAERVTVRLPVVSSTGVHDVTLVPVTTSGAPAGSTFDFVLRTSQVGLAVWVVIAAAGLLFAVTLLRRLRQRSRGEGRLRTRAARMREGTP